MPLPTRTYTSAARAARHGYRVLRRAPSDARTFANLARRRAQLRSGLAPARNDLDSYNRLFYRACVRSLAREKLVLETFDSWHFRRLNDPRLLGQIVFEYGTLANWAPAWEGLRVLDIGTGASRFPHWMAAQGADVTTLDLAAPAEPPQSRVFQSARAGIPRTTHRTPGNLHHEAGSMFDLPFCDNAFDLVTSLSVIEHVDTNFPDRTYVPYPGQQQLAARSLSEMIRVTRQGGHLYLTSDCCDYTRATSDAWRKWYYYDSGPPLSGAWPIGDVQSLFYDFVEARGCALVGRQQFVASRVDGSPEVETFRGKYWSAFSLLAQKLGRDAPARTAPGASASRSATC